VALNQIDFVYFQQHIGFEPQFLTFFCQSGAVKGTVESILQKTNDIPVSFQHTLLYSGLLSLMSGRRLRRPGPRQAPALQGASGCGLAARCFGTSNFGFRFSSLGATRSRARASQPPLVRTKKHDPRPVPSDTGLRAATLLLHSPDYRTPLHGRSYTSSMRPAPGFVKRKNARRTAPRGSAVFMSRKSHFS